jgi:AsmA protein
VGGILKIVLGLAGVLVAALLAIAAAVFFLVDPNEYRDTLAEAAQSAIGRELKIEGDLGLALMPCCSVTIGEASLANPDGFAGGMLATVHSAALSLKLVPLITERRIEIGRVVVDGLALDLVSDQQGRTNWTIDQSATSTPDAGEPGSGIPEIRLEGVELRDSSIRYRDLASGDEFLLTGIEVTTGAYTGAEPVSISGATKLALPASDVSAEIGFEGIVSFTQDDAAVVVSGLATTIDLKATGGEPYAAELKASAGDMTLSDDGDVRMSAVAADGTYTSGGTVLNGGLNADLLWLSDSEVRVPGLEIRGDYQAGDLAASGTAKLGPVLVSGGGQLVNIERVDASVDARLPALPGGTATGRVTIASVSTKDGGENSELTGLAFDLSAAGTQALFKGGGIVGANTVLEGRIRVPPFSPRTLIVEAGGTEPVTSDAEVLRSMSLDGDLSLGNDSIGIDDLTVKIDDTTAKGFFRLASIERQSLRFDLVGDAIDLDRYLAPAEADGDDEAAAPVDNVKLPVEALRELRMGGRIKLRSVHIDGMDLQDLVVNVVARNGDVRVQPLKGKLYSGSFDGGIFIDASGDTPGVRIEQKAAGIAIGDLLAARGELENLTGVLGVTIDASATGNTVGELKQSIDGQVGFELDDAVYEGIDVWQELRTQYARLKRTAPPAGPGEGRTRIEALGGSGIFQDGALVSDDFTARIPFIVATGQGRVDLVSDSIDYRLSALVETTPEFEDGERLEDLTGLRLPLTVSGPISDPDVSVDLAEVLKDVVVRELTDKVTNRLFDRLRRRLGEEDGADPQDNSGEPPGAGDQTL